MGRSHKELRRKLKVHTGEKTRRRLRVTPRFFIFLLMLFILYLGAGFVRRQLMLNHIEARIEETGSIISALEARNQALREKIEYLESDEYVEKVARQKLKLIYPGEEVYVITDPADPDNPFKVERREDAADDPAGY